MQVRWKDPLLQESVLSQRRLLPGWCLNCSKTKMLAMFVAIVVATIVVIFNMYHTGLASGQVVKCTGNRCLKSAGPSSMEGVLRLPPIRYRHTKRYLPQCLIIGARKAGTRALLQILNIHPLVRVAGREQHFFDDDDNYARGYDYYRHQMPYAFPGQIVIEKTPSYLHTPEVPERVHKMNASMKMLVILRDPVQRAISDFVQIAAKKESVGNDPGTFEENVYDYDTEEIKVSSPLLHRSIYVRHVQNWLEYFPLDQFHFVDGNKIIADPQKEITAVEDFLGLPRRIDEDNLVYNSTKGFYCFRNESINGTLNPPKCLGSTKGRSHPEVDPVVLQKLRQYFAPFNVKLFRLIHRKFDWPRN